jgi:large subunit ribosomal protein L4
MELQLINISGDAVERVHVNDAVFGVTFNRSLVHQAMVMYSSNLRQGTHSTKTRKEVSGGGAKPWRQKHTGRARHGSIRSPQWRHGGVVFGPKPRSHRRDMPKKMRQLALRCVLSQKVRDEKLVLLKDFEMPDGRTKTMAQTLSNMKIADSSLIVTKEPQSSVVRSAHNLPKVWTLPVALLNARELLKYGTVIITLDALRKAEDMLAPKTTGADNVIPEETSPEPIRLNITTPQVTLPNNHKSEEED